MRIEPFTEETGMHMAHRQDRRSTAHRPTRTGRGGSVTAALLLTGLLLPGGAAAQQGLPDARALIQRHVEFVGGAERILGIFYMVSRGTFSVPELGLVGELVIHQAPGKRAVSVELPGIGAIRNGFDGEVSWNLDPIQGARLGTGNELAQAREESTFAYSLRDPSLIERAETVERTERGGEPCWRVRILWRSGSESFDCYSVEGGQLVASERTQASAMGAVQVLSLATEYGEFDGMRTPTSLRQTAEGQSQVMRIESVEFPPLDSSVFELPAEVRALLPGR